MFKWIPYAFVRLLIFFAGGILIGINFPDILSPSTATGVLVTLCAIYILMVLSSLDPRIKGTVAFLAIALSGYVDVVWKNKPDDSIRPINKSLFYNVVLTQPPKENAKTWKCEALIKSAKDSIGWTTRDDKIILYASKDCFQKPPKYADLFLIKGNPQDVPGPANPEEFDYRKFLSYKHVYHQHFVRKDNLIILGNEPPDTFIQYAIATRLWADGILKKHIHGQREYAMASALVLGVTDGLDTDLMSAYSASGAMHVLSVSGLHVGIVYWLLTLLLKPLQRFKSGKWIMLAISLSVLWSYAFITGISASVLRAVMMFSFAIIAKTWNHRTNIYNILAASAFCLLAFDPFMIMSVGFQLSYLAVLGIVSIQPGLYRLWAPDKRIFDEIWKVVSVSIAAQLATMSVSFYYFHQFPNYFLITNLFVIPGSFVVLIAGILLLIFNFVGVIAALLGQLVYWIIFIMNTLVFGIEQLPFSVFNNVYIGTLQCWIGIILIGLFFGWINSKRAEWLVVSATLCMVYSVAGWFHYTNRILSNRITVYSIAGTTAIDFSSNGVTRVIGDSTIAVGMPVNKFHILSNRLMNGASTISEDTSYCKQAQGCNLISWMRKKIIHVKDKDFILPEGIAVDMIIISNNSVRNLSEVTKKVNADLIIVDSSNSYAMSSSMVRQAKDLNVNLTSVLKSGAYQLIF
ncbi:MAG: ComEC/Rec2 family competence protein [Chryseolinea sp.]